MTDFRCVVFFVCDFILFPDENAPRCSANFGSSQNLGGRAAWGRVCERADTADGMADFLRHFLRCEHLRLHAEALLEAVVVDFAIPPRNNQNQWSAASRRRPPQQPESAAPCPETRAFSRCAPAHSPAPVPPKQPLRWIHRVHGCGRQSPAQQMLRVPFRLT